MPGEDWVDKVKQYRLAVDAYCDAVDRMGSTVGDLGPECQQPEYQEYEWQQIERAHDEAERARTALLRQRRKPMFTHTRTLIFDEVSDYGTEELVLGDLGQSGG